MNAYSNINKVDFKAKGDTRNKDRFKIIKSSQKF